MDFIFELLIQVAFEVLGEFLVEIGFKGAAAVVRSRVGRAGIALVAGFGGGLWWGVRLSTRGRVQEPRALWVSIALATAAALGTARRYAHGASQEDALGLRSVLTPPWRWPAYRLLGFSLLNAAIALGIIIGFHPDPFLHRS